MKVTVVGAGLAGCEAAWQLAQHGVAVDLVEMKPGCMSPAHVSADFAELVCSNSLKADTVPVLACRHLIYKSIIYRNFRVLRSASFASINSRVFVISERSTFIVVLSLDKVSSPCSVKA